MRGS
jgi:hypothetical protein